MARLWKIDRDRLLVRNGARLPPDVCLRTGQRSPGPPVRTLVRFTSKADIAATAVLIMVGLVYGRSYVGWIHHGLAGRHRWRRQIGLSVMALAAASLVGGAIAGTRVGSMAMLVGMLTFIVGSVLGDAIRGTEITAVGLEGDWLVLDCASPVVDALRPLEAMPERDVESGWLG